MVLRVLKEPVYQLLSKRKQEHQKHKASMDNVAKLSLKVKFKGGEYNSGAVPAWQGSTRSSIGFPVQKQSKQKSSKYKKNWGYRMTVKYLLNMCKTLGWIARTG